MRLVDADKIFDGKLLRISAEAYDAVHAIIEKINNAPTVDAVEVIRCKDCEYFLSDEPTICELTMCGAKDDGFCAWAERKRDAKEE